MMSYYNVENVGVVGVVGVVGGCGDGKGVENVSRGRVGEGWSTEKA